jgi:hypothetical protein
MSNSETPASHLARVRVQHPGWRIGHRDVEPASGPGASFYVATRPGERIQARTVGELEAALIAAESRRDLS